MSKLLAWKARTSEETAAGRAQETPAVAEGVREATTGQVMVQLPRVWAVAGEASPELAKEASGEKSPQPELAFYRKYTEAMLRRYLRLSMETGRVPSLMGREMFRGNVTRYRVRSFEDVVIFCHDVERCLVELNGDERQLIKRIALQEYTQGETASMLGVSLRQCIRQYGMAVDHLTAILLRTGLLEPMTACQGGKRRDFAAND